MYDNATGNHLPWECRKSRHPLEGIGFGCKDTILFHKKSQIVRKNIDFLHNLTVYNEKCALFYHYLARTAVVHLHHIDAGGLAVHAYAAQ